MRNIFSIAVFLFVLFARPTFAEPQLVAKTIAVLPGTNDLLSATITSPQSPKETWTRSGLTVPICREAPKIDGKLDEACWKDATHVSGFYRYVGTEPIPEQTEAWICADKTHLYIAFHCLETQPQLIRATQTQRGGDVSNDDWLNVDIDSQNSHRSVSSFWVTSRGTQRESLEGGTADNITWAGDWKAATQRTSDGWTAEIGIPFALLRYPKGAKSFCIGLFRKLGRETTSECWPYFPPNGNQNEELYLASLTGINPPFYAPRPIMLPYVLASAGSGNTIQQGLDIKYPLTTTLTGLATIHPDFRTIEQDVSSINFSYNEQYINDRRPFFAEGRNYFPAPDLFYSPRVPFVDGGLKLFGKEGNTGIAFLGTATQGTDRQGSAVLRINQDFGQLSSVAFSMIENNQSGEPNNNAAKIAANYIWKAGPDQFKINSSHMQSWLGGQAMDSKDDTSVGLLGRPGHPFIGVDHMDIGPNFINQLGYVPEKDIVGNSFSVEQANQFDRGRLESYDAGFDLSAYQHHTGGFFHNDVDAYAYATSRAGVQVGLSADFANRDQFHDHTGSLDMSWNRKTLFQRGAAYLSIGRVTSQPYRYTSLSQGFLITRAFSMQVNFNQLHLGDTKSTQSVLTGTYLLNSAQTVGARVVQQDGGTDVYFSFGQHVRAGSDLYVLFGDPNSPKTRGIVTVKVISPF